MNFAVDLIAPGQCFNAWVEHAAAERDFTIEVLKAAKSEEEKAQRLEELREELNRQ